MYLKQCILDFQHYSFLKYFGDIMNGFKEIQIDPRKGNDINENKDKDNENLSIYSRERIGSHNFVDKVFPED